MSDPQTSNEGNKHLFLTGATGFFGRSLLRHIDRLSQSHKNPWVVTAMTRSKTKFLSAYPEFAEKTWLSFHEGDVLKPETFPSQFTCTHILHAAADSTPDSIMTALSRFDQIVTGTRNTLDFAVWVGAQRILLTSSGDVYGPQPIQLGRIPETYLGVPDPLHPNSAYGIAKRAAEHLCALYAEQFAIEVLVARCFAFVGPDLPLDAHFAVGNFIRDALEHKEICVKGDGSPMRSYLYQDDLAFWLLKILADGKNGAAYNVGSDEDVSIAELATIVRDILSPGKPVRILQKSMGHNEARHRYLPDINKACRELQLKVKTPLALAISETNERLTEIKKRKGARAPKSFAPHLLGT